MSRFDDPGEGDENVGKEEREREPEEGRWFANGTRCCLKDCVGKMVNNQSINVCIIYNSVSFANFISVSLRERRYVQKTVARLSDCQYKSICKF